MKIGVFSVDFDGTCVTAEFPYVGRNIGAQYVLKQLADNGNKIILFTLRGRATYDWDHNPLPGDVLQDAVNWFESHNIPLWGVNVNPQQESDKWTDSPKPFSNVIIDDYNVCAPIKEILNVSTSVTVVTRVLDWKEISRWLYRHEYITEEQLFVLMKKIEKDWSRL